MFSRLKTICGFKKRPDLALLEKKAKTLESFLGFCEGKNVPLRPLGFSLEVSTFCNYNCVMCPRFSKASITSLIPNRYEKKNLRLDAVHRNKSLADCMAYGFQVHLFGYGEPTLNNNFLQFIEMCSQFDLLVDFFTNGSTLNKYAEHLISNTVNQITISVSGATAEDYNKIYRNGDFDNVISGITKLSELKNKMNSPYPRIAVNSISFAHHMKKLPEFVEIMADAGVNLIFVRALSLDQQLRHIWPLIAIADDATLDIAEKASRIAKDRGVTLSMPCLQLLPKSFNYDEAVSLRGREAQSNSFDLNAQEIYDNILDGKSLTLDCIDNFIDKLPGAAAASNISFEECSVGSADDAATSTELINKPKECVCLEPFRQVFIDIDGNLRPCCFAYPQPLLGNIFSGQPFGELWNEPRLVKVREAMLGPMMPKFCTGCVKLKHYPLHHMAGSIAYQFSKMMQHKYDYSFAPDLVKKAVQLPNNAGVLQKWDAGS